MKKNNKQKRKGEREKAILITHVDHGEDGADGDDEDDRDDDEDVGDGHNCAFFTFDTLASTPSGVTFPIIVTFFVSLSILNDVTPAHN